MKKILLGLTILYPIVCFGQEIRLECNVSGTFTATVRDNLPPANIAVSINQVKDTMFISIDGPGLYSINALSSKGNLSTPNSYHVVQQLENPKGTTNIKIDRTNGNISVLQERYLKSLNGDFAVLNFFGKCKPQKSQKNIF
jgi:hypothetical protein